MNPKAFGAPWYVYLIFFVLIAVFEKVQNASIASLLGFPVSK